MDSNKCQSALIDRLIKRKTLESGETICTDCFGRVFAALYVNIQCNSDYFKMRTSTKYILCCTKKSKEKYLQRVISYQPENRTGETCHLRNYCPALVFQSLTLTFYQKALQNWAIRGITCVPQHTHTRRTRKQYHTWNRTFRVLKTCYTCKLWSKALVSVGDDILVLTTSN